MCGKSRQEDLRHAEPSVFMHSEAKKKGSAIIRAGVIVNIVFLLNHFAMSIPLSDDKHQFV